MPVLQPSTVTAQQLADYCGSSLNADVERSLGVAEVLVADAFAEAYKTVPEAVHNQVVLEVGFALLKRSDSPSGGSQGVEYGTGQAVQGPKDPMTQVWPIIRRYVLPF